MLLSDHKRDVLLSDHKRDVLLPEYNLGVLRHEYKGDVLLPEPSCSVGFIEDAKLEILTALLLTFQVCCICYCVIS